MGKVSLLDCTLRDGGYINNWEFGEKGIRDIIRKLERTGIEMIEVGFLKGNQYNPSKSLFPDIESIKNILTNKEKVIKYVVMFDLSDPIPIERITPYDGTSIDGIRVIFKKNRIDEAYKVCEYIKSAGYELFVNFVSTDLYSDRELIDGIEKFNNLNPTGLTIVDTFGTIKKKNFVRLVSIADNNLNEGIKLCYHAHNNLQQAYGNAEAMVEMNLKREIVIDACVFGMGRGAGNLNLELFAEYMNDNYDKKYRIYPMLEIMDEYLNEFYKTKFWGYSLPLYLSATHGCHPNYAIYLAEKNSLSEKAFDELLKDISEEDKHVFSKVKAEKYYKKYMENYVNDDFVINSLGKKFRGKNVLLLAPGKTIKEYYQKIRNVIEEECLVICVNFYDDLFTPNYVFAGNIRRYNKIVINSTCELICTSNIPNHEKANYVINYSSFTGNGDNVNDNSGLMALRFLEKVGANCVMIAGMDGYSESEVNDYYESGFNTYSVNGICNKNEMISSGLQEINKHLPISFITPTLYKL